MAVDGWIQLGIKNLSNLFFFDFLAVFTPFESSSYLQVFFSASIGRFHVTIRWMMLKLDLSLFSYDAISLAHVCLSLSLSLISRHGESNYHRHDNSGLQQPGSAPNTQRSPTHGCPKRRFVCLWARMFACVHMCVYVGKTQGLLEKQSNYRTVIYAIAWPCLQSAALFKFVTILGRLFFNLIYIRA